MARGFSERNCCEMLLGKTHGKHSHVAIGLNPLAMVQKHATAWDGVMHAEGMAAYLAEKFGED